MEVRGLYYSQQPNSNCDRRSNGLEQLTFPGVIDGSYDNQNIQYLDQGNNNAEEAGNHMTSKRLHQQEDRIKFRYVPTYVLDRHESAVQHTITLYYTDYKRHPRFHVRLPLAARCSTSSAGDTGDSPSSAAGSQVSTLSDFTPPINESHESSLVTDANCIDHERSLISDFENANKNQVCEDFSNLERLELVDVSSEVEKSVKTTEDGAEDSGSSHFADETAIHAKTSQSSAPGRSVSPLASSFCEEDKEFEFLKVTSARRCSSVKNLSTSSSWRKKKEVRFADVLGLDLESVKHVAFTSGPPAVRVKALQDAKLNTILDDERKTRVKQELQLSACFIQPSCTSDFESRVSSEKVLLESLSTNDIDLSITGCVRVVNIAYLKRVFVRYSIDGWTTYSDVEASYLGGSKRGRFDKFLFRIQLPESSFGFGSWMEFAIRYDSAGRVYWDNNSKANYRIECHYKQVP